ncbi:MAG: MFS transporter [Verrucomicrobiota bacterium]
MGIFSRRRVESAADTPALSERALNTRRMYRFDLARGGAHGVLESCWHTFALIVLIRYFDAGESVKQNVPAAYGWGLVLVPFVLAWASRRTWSLNRYAAAIWGGVAVAMAVAATARHEIVFLGAMIVAQVLFAQAIPVLTHLYDRNYPPSQRGQRLSTAMLLTGVTGMLFGPLGGRLLDWSIGLYPVVFGLAALAALVGAFAVARMPAGRLADLNAGGLGHNLITAWSDRVFRWLLIAWMLMGVGNLMLIPIRVEYLANERYAINASNFEIAFLMAFIVPAFRLLSTKIWGFVFDRLNLMTVRLLLNGCFMVSMYLFFFTDSLFVMGVGVALLGVAFGGGSVMWTLWVTKIAPPGQVSAYMGVHGFFTGLRASVAPFLGYALVAATSPRFAAVISISLIAASSGIFLLLRPALERYRQRELLNDE